jgi:hypothetical protein
LLTIILDGNTYPIMTSVQELVNIYSNWLTKMLTISKSITLKQLGCHTMFSK